MISVSSKRNDDNSRKVSMGTRYITRQFPSLIKLNNKLNADFCNVSQSNG